MLDFAENYAYVVQNEIQSYHWCNDQCTIHPAVMYYIGDDGKLNVKSFTFISKDLSHDTPFVYEVQRRIIEVLRQSYPFIYKVLYFSDGCAGQYKNFKNFINICYHKDDFGLEAEWNFFATSHGKSAVDGIGGTVKRTAARASLQKFGTEQILTAEAMYNFCSIKIPSIIFQLITEEDMRIVRESQHSRYEGGKTVPGTRGFHLFCPISNNQIAFKRVSDVEDFSGTFTFKNSADTVSNLQSNVKAMDYVACKYDANWWIGIVLVMDDEEQDLQIQFLHPSGPARNFYWPPRNDTCWVPINNIICKIKSPTTLSGRTYNISDDDYSSIISLL